MVLIGDLPEPHPSRVRPKVLAALPWMLVLLLLGANTSTLLNDRAHAAAYGVIEAIVRHLGSGAAEAILSRSPTRATSAHVTNSTRVLRAEAAVTDARLRTLTDQHVRLQQTAEALSKEKHALAAAAKVRAAQVRDLAMRTNTTLERRSLRSVKSLPSRAIPYAGIAFSVAFTTAEVTVDCEVARTLSDLAVQHGQQPVNTGTVCGYVNQVPSAAEIWSTAKKTTNVATQAIHEALERLWP